MQMRVYLGSGPIWWFWGFWWRQRRRRRRCCSGAEVVLREVMSLNAHGVHAEQMPPSEGADVEGF